MVYASFDKPNNTYDLTALLPPTQINVEIQMLSFLIRRAHSKKTYSFVL